MAKQQSNQRVTRTQPLKATWPSSISITNHTAIPSSTIGTSGQNHANRTFLKAHSKSGPFLEGLPVLSSKRAMVPRQQVQQPEPGTMKNMNGHNIVPGIQVPITPEPTDLTIASSTDRTLRKVAERRRRIGALLEEIDQAEPLCDKPLPAPLSFHKLVVSPSIKEYTFQYEPVEDFPTTKHIHRPVSASSNLPSPLPSLSQDLVNHSTQTKRTIARSSSLSSISVPSTSQQPDKNRDTDRMDFVRLNSLAAKNVPVRVKPGRVKSKVAEAGTPHLHGQVPKYLERRKAEWAAVEEEKLRNQPDPECPPGHMLMSEAERLETLEMLQKSYEESVMEVNKMPVRNDTLRVRAKREELEQQMAKLEEGIRILSRPKVFVKLDN